jgi:hypothetical protein
LPTTPQYFPDACVQTVGLQLPESSAAPHTWEMPPPPHVSLPGQTPQSIWPPQPLPTTPQ